MKVDGIELYLEISLCCLFVVLLSVISLVYKHMQF